MPDAWTSFDESLRSRECLRDQHGDCGHFNGLGGGINPRRLRPEFGAGLCPCTCHTSCPVTITTRRMTVPVKTWYDSCTCPGADQARQSLDDAGGIPDFGARWEESRNRSRAGKEAFTAAKARAGGKNREEIRRLYLAELQARNLSIPDDPILDTAIDSITGNPLPAARLLGHKLITMAKEIHKLTKLFTQGH
jgi:hypothetical protein